MPELKMMPKLHTINVLLPESDDDPRYKIVLQPDQVDTRAHTLEEAIAYLRQKGMKAAQIVNGPEVYIITWGPLLAPWEGEPG